MCVLAVEISDTIIHWALGLLGVALPAIGTAIYVGWHKLIGFFSPMIRDAFTAHTGLVNEMREQIPVVGETLKKLGETQQQQCDTLARHDELHEEHRQKLNELIRRSGNHDVQPG